MWFYQQIKHCKLFMKIVLLVLISFLSYNTILSQEQPKSSLLWQITGKGIKQPSYLFGTFHIICKEDFVISDLLQQKLLSTKALFEEMKMDDPNFQMQMMLKLRSDTTIESLLDSNMYNKLAIQFQKITGISINFFKGYKPFMLSSMLAQKMIPCTNVIQPETEFIKIAKKKNIPIEGLELIDDELEAINKLPLDSQINTIIKMVNNFDSAKQMMQEIIIETKRIDPKEKFIKINHQNKG